MRYEMTEDEVRDVARTELGLEISDEALSGVGQLTSFHRLGFQGIKDRPDGWYLPNDTNLTAIILEVKGSNVTFTDSCLLYTSPSPRDKRQSRMPSSA